MGLCETRNALQTRLEAAGIAVVTQESASLTQVGNYLVFESADFDPKRPCLYKFAFFVVSHDLEGDSGAFQTLDKLGEIYRKEAQETGRSSIVIEGVNLRSFEGGLNIYKVEISAYERN